jgi:DNA/RNA-binding domain of Phe-tRNA-synthetase-like protein
MKNIDIDPALKNKCPQLRLGCLSCSVKIAPSSPALTEFIAEGIKGTAEKTIDIVSRLPGIAAAKRAYRALGKDPSRYRPSAEALTRRIIKGKGLYHVNNVVDILNLISIQSGFSIGGYDEDKIRGPVMMRSGRTGEPYEAIGRGSLNIENLPVLQDAAGVFGSPTSDSIRTMIEGETKNILMIFFDFESEKHLEQVLEESTALLTEHARAGEVVTAMIV